MITVIIPTYNATEQLDKLLSKLTSQTKKDFDILIIDSSSDDNTLDRAKSYNCATMSINKSDFDHGTTRNLAASKVKSEFIAFLTQDAIPADEHLIAELIKPMQTDSNIAVCYGRQLLRPNARPLESFARQFNYPEQSILKTKNDIETLGLGTFFCSNSCSAIRRSIFVELGGFKNNVIVNEDMLFAAKAILKGYSVYYSSEAKVYHSHPHSLSQTFRRYFNIGRFFADNRRLLEQTGLKSYSSNMLKAGAKTFWHNGIPYYFAALLIEFTAKALACKFGWYYQILFRENHDTYL